MAEEVEPRAAGRAARVVERMLDVADVSNVYGAPIEHGDTLLIPTAEVLSVAGFGMGSGAGTDDEGRRGGGGGGGGGGQAFARGVAVVVSSPEGVRVKPIVDVTKIALAALTAAGFVWTTWSRMAKPRRR